MTAHFSPVRNQDPATRGGVSYTGNFSLLDLNAILYSQDPESLEWRDYVCFEYG